MLMSRTIESISIGSFFDNASKYRLNSRLIFGLFIVCFCDFYRYLSTIPKQNVRNNCIFFVIPGLVHINE